MVQVERVWDGDFKVAKVRERIDWKSPATAIVVQKLAQSGMTNTEIAKMLDVSGACLTQQKKMHPHIENALLEGRSKATVNVIAETYKRATGYTYTEEVLNKDGSIVKLKKHMPANPTMQIFWLTNRDGDNWKNSRELKIQQENSLGVSSGSPERDKIRRLYGTIFGEDTDRTVRECSFSDEAARDISSGQVDAGDICGDVPVETPDSVQDDVLDIPAEAGTI